MVTKTTNRLTSDEMEDLLLMCIVEKAPCHLGDLNELKDREGRTLLHWSISLRLREETEYLLKQGANPNIADDEGKTPLHYAASIGDSDITRILIEAGADVNARDRYGRTPLHYANSATAVVLLSHGADVNVKDFAGNTPLHTAPEAVEVLLAHGADPNVKNEKGLPPIYYAIKKGNCRAASLLLKVTNRELLSLRDENGDTLLHWAIDRCRELARELIENFNIDINAANNDGNTPLHYAALNRDVEIIKLLLNHGADIRAKNVHGLTPLSLLALMCRDGTCIDEVIDRLNDEEIESFVRIVFSESQRKLVRKLLERGFRI